VRLLRSGGVARLLVRLPGIGERARIYELSRLYLTLGMLSEGGIADRRTRSRRCRHGLARHRAGPARGAAAIESGLPLSTPSKPTA
jgi:general secretion pathway protein F